MPDHAVGAPPLPAASRARAVVLALLVALAAAVVLALLRPPDAGTTSTALLAAVLLVPLALPLRGLLLRDRRTYAWATLSLTPHFVYALTELVANPMVRVHAAAILLLALALMVALVAYLRFTRGSDQ